MSENALHILITAGPTREKIDEVREWGNIFSGQTGLDLALAFLDVGSVTLLTSNKGHAAAYDGYSGKAGMLGVETFATHAELHELLAERMTSGDKVDVVAMTAAVADYVPAGSFQVMKREARGDGLEAWTVREVSAPKVKSNHAEIAVLGKATLKLIDEFRGTWRYRGLLIKFKLEVGIKDDELLKVAGNSRVASGADLMVANTLAMARPGGGAEGSAFLIDEEGAQAVARNALARAVVGWARGRSQR